jgi:hypothetical protein
VGIADGDTFTMLLDNKTTINIKIRLASIDCPERKQPYSAVATKFLSDHIFGNREKVVVARVTWTLDWEQEGVGKLPPNFDMIDTWKKNENGIWQILSRVSQMLNEPYSN